MRKMFKLSATGPDSDHQWDEEELQVEISETPTPNN